MKFRKKFELLEVSFLYALRICGVRYELSVFHNNISKINMSSPGKLLSYFVSIFLESTSFCKKYFRSTATVFTGNFRVNRYFFQLMVFADMNGFEKIPIFPYSVKYASSFYGPFRNAVDSKLEIGDRKTHQMNFKNTNEFIREIEYDINEGCDAIIIKPALAYLDIISKAKENFNIPIIAYNVSGEYAMVKSAAENNQVDEYELTMEILYAIKRAGASAIITYNAEEIAKILSNK